MSCVTCDAADPYLHTGSVGRNCTAAHVVVDTVCPLVVSAACLSHCVMHRSRTN